MDYLLSYVSALVCGASGLSVAFVSSFHNGHADLDVACGEVVCAYAEMLCILGPVITDGGRHFF